MQYTSKMKSRDIPVLLRHYEQHDTPPPHFVLGFAAYILFMRGGQPPHPVNDDKAGYFADLWKKYPAPEVTTIVLKNKELWGADLSQLHGFEGAVRLALDDLISRGSAAALAKLASQKSTI